MMPWKALIVGVALLGCLPAGFGSVCLAADSQRTVLENVEFEADSSVLKNTSIPALRELLAELQRNPDLVIVVEGHTAASGSEEHDLALARDRAQAVFNWLTANGADPERIQVVGYGSSRPRSQSSAASDNAGNHRLEIVKIRNLHPNAVVPETEFTFPPVVDGTDVVHDFVVYNRGKGPLSIHRVKTG